MLKIYGYAQSINVRKVLWACEEMGIAFEREDWGGAFRSTSDPQFRALNPVGMVPVIDDDGKVVWGVERHRSISRRESRAHGSSAERARATCACRAVDGLAGVRLPITAGECAFRRSCAGTRRFRTKRRLTHRPICSIGWSASSTRSWPAPAATSPTTVSRWRILQSACRYIAAQSVPMPRPRYANVERYLGRLSERSGFVRYGRDSGP